MPGSWFDPTDHEIASRNVSSYPAPVRAGLADTF